MTVGTTTRGTVVAGCCWSRRSPPAGAPVTNGAAGGSGSSWTAVAAPRRTRWAPPLPRRIWSGRWPSWPARGRRAAVPARAAAPAHAPPWPRRPRRSASTGPTGAASRSSPGSTDPAPAGGDGRTVRIALPLSRPWTGDLTVTAARSRHVEPLTELAAGQLAVLVENHHLPRRTPMPAVWLPFLADAGELLAQSLDVDLTVALLPRLAGPPAGPVGRRACGRRVRPTGAGRPHPRRRGRARGAGRATWIRSRPGWSPRSPAARGGESGRAADAGSGMSVPCRSAGNASAR